MDQFCSLCGVILEPCEPLPNPSDPPKRLDWKREIRAVASDGGLSPVTLTGVGFLDPDRHDLLASSDPETSYMSPGHGETWSRHPLISLLSDERAFGFHEICWQLFLQKVTLTNHNPARPQRIAQLLFQLLYCLPYDNFDMPCHSHDFGGALTFCRKDPEDLPKPWRFLMADPRTFTFNSTNPAPRNDSLLPRATTDSQIHDDIFAKLSPEMVHLIIVMLESTDLCNLRLSSKFVSKLTSLDHLSQNFWKSRFSVDREMGFFLPFSNFRIDWRSLYFNLRHSLLDTTGTGHMRNRRRIWLCLDALAQTLIPLLDQHICLLDLGSVQLDVASESCESKRSVHTPALNEDCRDVPMGARLFGYQYIIFRPQNSGPYLRISVSRILFDGVYYISGIRLSESNDMDTFEEFSRAGYIIPHDEFHMPLHPNDCLTGMRVAASASGIVGLGFRIRTWTDDIVWKNVGVVTHLPDGVGVANMEPCHDTRLRGVILGLDVCKIVSLQVLERVQRQKLRDTPTQIADYRSALWHPGEPDTSGRDIIYPLTPVFTRADNPLFLNMDFGGPGGALVSRLNRISALHDETSGHFRGFAFYYIDGHTASFGLRTAIASASKRSTCIEQSICIDGPSGERIVFLEVQTYKAYVSGDIRAIKLRTSYNRTMEFRTLAKPGEEEEKYSRQIISPPTGMTISAILASVEFCSGAVQSLGIQYAYSTASTTPSLPRIPFTDTSVEEDNPHSFPNSKDVMYNAPANFWRGNGCFASVMLASIRRIGVSTGIPGRTRGLDHIAGLCFEFWGSTEQVYLGQWYREVGCLSVKEDERICGFTFWQQQEHLSHGLDTVLQSHGSIAGIRIAKTGLGRRDVEIILGDKNDMLPYSLTENPYERLTGLAWVFNRECDYTYSLTRPSHHFPGVSLALRYMLGLWPASRPPEKLTWLAEDEEGNLFKVSKVHAVFSRTSGKLCGFVFDYGAGQISRTAGSADGVKASFDLDREEYIIRIALQLWRHESEVVVSDDITYFKFKSNEQYQFYTSAGRVYALSPSGSCGQPRERDLSTYEGFDCGDLKDGSRYRYKVNECVGIWIAMAWRPGCTNLVHTTGAVTISRATSQ
ncbi:hypothetical protein FANTH_9505 [Fusarium anthophilum]|uniref:DUF7600 domain-containing protein n=1 Tax=Fusarium anthophilum TaxID=48485 RepID=A0A8H4Z6M3_9HYPO|nr:hypothetical protein FANTH_9505 [Fusarium anthophilum]